MGYESDVKSEEYISIDVDSIVDVVLEEIELDTKTETAEE